MAGRVELTESNAVDIARRYDIYVKETESRVVVYRNAFFRGSKELDKGHRTEVWADYIEIEQSDGTSVFLRKYAVVAFCDAGTKLTCECSVENLICRPPWRGSGRCE